MTNRTTAFSVWFNSFKLIFKHNKRLGKFHSFNFRQIKVDYYLKGISVSAASDLYYKSVIKSSKIKKPKSPSLKWKYDAKFKQWYTPSTAPAEEDGFDIGKNSNGTNPYVLTFGHLRHIGRFKKLGNAKMVAYLLRHG